MKRLLVLAALLAIGCAFQRTTGELTARELTNYEMLFSGVGAASILFMVVVVAAGSSQDALPPAFERRALPAGGHCLVCNAHSASEWVACVRCSAPYHFDCVKYVRHCAVLGCEKALAASPTKKA